MAKRKRPARPQCPSEDVIHALLKLNTLVNKFKTIERAIWFAGTPHDRPERDGEHAFQVALMAWLANSYAGLDLDGERIMLLALVHDLIEAYAGDTPAVIDPVCMDEETTPSQETKEAREFDAFMRIEREFGGVFPDLVAAMHEYMAHTSPEATFVSAFEKLIAMMNIFQDGGRTYRRLGAGFSDNVRINRRKIGKHPVVHDWFEWLVEHIRREAAADPDKYLTYLRPAPILLRAGRKERKRRST